MKNDRLKTLPEIMHNCRVKTYPNGTQEVLFSRDSVFRETGWQLADKWQADAKVSGTSTDKAASLDRAKRRARNAVRDIALSNEFSYFVTFTLDASKVDRYDINAVVKKMNYWLDNRVRRNGLKYVLVPELHKDGAVHFHGFVNDCLGLVDSGTLTGGELKRPRKPRSARERDSLLASGCHVVYNVTDWKLGFSTAIELYGEYRSAVGYVCKYISKAQEKIGGRWYYSGGQLDKPSVSLTDIDFDAFLSDNNDDAQLFKSGGLEFGIMTLGVSRWSRKRTMPTMP